MAARNGGGKGAVAQYIKTSLGAEHHTYLDIIYETYLLWGCADRSRDDGQKLWDFMRKQKGEDVLSRALTRRVESASGNLVVVDGARRLVDLELLIETFGRENVVSIWVETSADRRYARLKEREEKTGERFMPRTKFDREERAEAEKHLDQVRAACMQEIDNNGTLEQLEERLSFLCHDLVVGPC